MDEIKLCQLDQIILESIAVSGSLDEFGLIRALELSTNEPASWLSIECGLQALNVLGFVETRCVGVDPETFREIFSITESGLVFLTKDMPISINL